MNNKSTAYQGLCTEYYELDKPLPPTQALEYYRQEAHLAKGPILEPMCGTGRFLIPLLKEGFDIQGFDSSSHMLNLCHKKCEKEGLSTSAFEGTFESFSSNKLFKLVIIPSGSFGLLTQTSDINTALQAVHKNLDNDGKFIFEVDTLNCIESLDNNWKAQWIDKPNGQKLVLNTISKFDSQTRIHTTLCRYERWENNLITATEVEEFSLRLFDMAEVENLLVNNGFKLLNKFIPYNKTPADSNSKYILYEFVKS